VVTCLSAAAAGAADQNQCPSVCFALVLDSAAEGSDLAFSHTHTHPKINISAVVNRSLLLSTYIFFIFFRPLFGQSWSAFSSSSSCHSTRRDHQVEKEEGRVAIGTATRITNQSSNHKQVMIESSTSRFFDIYLLIPDTYVEYEVEEVDRPLPHNI
jgi:hypothetical protein